MLKTIALIVVVALVALLAFATTRPDTFRVERQATIQAPPDKIFAYLQDFHKWSEWSPWEKLDPAMKRTFSGTASGKGAVYAWDGSGKAGAGRMEILDAPQPTKLMGIFFNMDKLIGNDFETGLANLKGVAEK